LLLDRFTKKNEWNLTKTVLPQHTDHAGVMWHGSYFNFLEEGRIDALNRAGISYSELSKKGIEIPVISSDKNSFKQINRITLNSIIKPRVEETLEIAWQKIKQYNFHNKKIKNVIITGGGAQLEGIEEYVKMIFSSNVRTAKPHQYLNLQKEFNKPNFSDLLGTIIYDNNDFIVNDLKSKSNLIKKTRISGFFSWLDQYI